MKRKGRSAFYLSGAVLAALALCAGIGYYASRGRAEPVKVYSFADIGMTEYWGDNRESEGIVTADRVQTVYLSDTQRVKQVMVQQGDKVKKGDVLVTFDTTLSEDRGGARAIEGDQPDGSNGDPCASAEC